jgi:hypothetical protein
MSKMGFHDPFGHLKHKVWPKEGSGVNLSMTIDHLKYGIALISLRASCV